MSKGFESKDKPKIKDIRERAFAFAVRIVKLCQYLEKDTKVSRTLITQLLKAGTSVGANLEEAQAGQSKPDFISKNAIALKEARESKYWLRLISATNTFEEKVKMGIEELAGAFIRWALPSARDLPRCSAAV